MQRDSYKFTITRNEDSFEANPNGFYEGNFKYTQNEGQVFFRKEFDGELSFRGSDYGYFKARYDGGNYCDVYEILIEKKVSGVYQVDWQGYFSMTDGKFDFDKCRYKVTPTVNDKYSCLLRNWETEVNIITSNPANILSKVKSTIEFEVEYDYGMAQPYHSQLQEMYYINRYSVLAGGEAHAHFSCRLAILLPEGTSPSPIGNWVQWDEIDYYIYPITVINRLEPATGFKKWVLNGSNVAWKPLIDDIKIVNSEFTYNNSDYRLLGVHKWEGGNGITYNWNVYILKSSVYFSGEEWPVSLSYRGYTILESILKVLKGTCDDFSSSTITAPMFTAAINPATGEANKLLGTYLIQKSDAKRPGASNPATKGLWTFKDAMEAIYSIFQIWWDIDENNNLILKHQNEIENIQGIDITVSPYNKTTAHKNAVEFNKSLLFRYEKWEFMEAKGEDFVGLPIEYSELCVSKDNDNKTKTYNVPFITTDLGYIQQNNSVSDDGFCLVTTSNSTVITGNGIITGMPQINIEMSLASLHDLYWRHNRILSSGLMNGAETEFESTQKIQKLDDLSIIYSEELEPLKLITTELGDAIVNEAEFSPMRQTYNLQLSI